MHRHPRILVEAPVGRHFCQIHDRPAELTQAVSDYTRLGLANGNAVVLAAEPERLAAVAAALKAAGLDPAAYQATAQLSMLDAHDLIERIVGDGQPDERAFRDIIGGNLARVSAAGHRHTRVYGELVNVLWRDGRQSEAIALEELWNELAFEHRFSLFCGYEIPGLDEHAHAAPLQEIARCHSDVLETVADDRLQHAIDRASGEILGLPISSALCYFGHSRHEAEHRLPAARRTVLWLKRNMPGAVGKVLARARVHYDLA